MTFADRFEQHYATVTKRWPHWAEVLGGLHAAEEEAAERSETPSPGGYLEHNHLHREVRGAQQATEDAREETMMAQAHTSNHPRAGVTRQVGDALRASFHEPARDANTFAGQQWEQVANRAHGNSDWLEQHARQVANYHHNAALAHAQAAAPTNPTPGLSAEEAASATAQAVRGATVIANTW